MIDISKLEDSDIGRWVIYVPKLERGRIKSFNRDSNSIFVVYAVADDWDDYQDFTGASTNPRDLVFEETSDA